MPLPVIFKFISDTSGSKFDKVISEMGEVKVGSERAGRAVRSLASILRDGQDPALALAGAFENLSRSLKLGIGATVAIVGAIEVIKSFVKNADDMNKATESLNSSLDTFRSQSENLDLSGALSQIRILTKELEKASQAGKQRPEDKLFGTIADVLGGAEMKKGVAQQGARQAIGSARIIAEQSILEEGRIQILRITNKLEADKLQITERYVKKLNEARDAGLSESSIKQLQIQQAIDLEQADIQFANNERERIQKESEEKTRLAEKEAREKEQLEKIEEQNHQTMLKRIDEQKKARDDFYKGGFEGAGGLLDRIKEAAQRQGRNDIMRRIDTERANLQKATDKLLISRLGENTGEKRFEGMSTVGIERERISGFAQMEANVQRESNRLLFNQVDAVRQTVQSILKEINERLGVPILRSAN